VQVDFQPSTPEPVLWVATLVNIRVSGIWNPVCHLQNSCSPSSITWCALCGSVGFSFFFKDFIYLCERERMRERAWERGGSEGEADSLLSREPDAGLNPGTPGPRPEPKAVAQPTEPPRRPRNVNFKVYKSSGHQLNQVIKINAIHNRIKWYHFPPVVNHWGRRT